MDQKENIPYTKRLKNFSWYPFWGMLFSIVFWIGSGNHKLLLLAIGSAGVLVLVLLVMAVLKITPEKDSKKNKPRAGPNGSNHESLGYVQTDVASKAGTSVMRAELSPESIAGNADDWSVVIEHFPSIKSIEDSLSLYPNDLRSTFVSTLLASKQFDEAEKLASDLRNDFLRERFGLNPQIQKVGKNLIENGEVDAAEELSKATAVLGDSIAFEDLASRIIKKYSIDRAVFYKGIFGGLSKNDFEWAKALSDEYRLESDGTSFRFVSELEYLPNYTADSEEDAAGLVVKIQSEKAQRELKWKRAEKRGMYFLFAMMLVVVIVILLLTSK